MNAQPTYIMARERRTRLRRAKPMSDRPAIRRSRSDVDNYLSVPGGFGHRGCGLGARLWARLVAVAAAGHITEFSNGLNPDSPGAIASGADGYIWQRDGSPIRGQTTPTYTPTGAKIGHQVACPATVTYALPFRLTATATSAAIHIQPSLPPPTPPTPALSALDVSPRTFMLTGRRVGAAASARPARTAATPAAPASRRVTWAEGERRAPGNREAGARPAKPAGGPPTRRADLDFRDTNSIAKGELDVGLTLADRPPAESEILVAAYKKSAPALTAIMSRA